MKKSNNIPSGYKSSPLGLIPKDWSIEELSSVFEYINTPSFSRDNLTNEKTKNEIYYIHYGDIHATYKTELLNFDIETKIPFLKDEFYSENFNFLKEGDLVIADASEDYEGVGECIEIKNINKRKVIGGLHTIVIRDNSKKTSPGFRTYIFRNKQIHNELKKIATGTSVYGISKGNLSKIKLPLPPLTEQKAIACLLNTWDDAIQNITQLIDKKEHRKKWLMQKLLTGKKRLKGFEKEKWKNVKLGEVFNERNETGNLNLPLLSVGANGIYPQSDSIKKDTSNEDKSKYRKICVGDIGYNTMRMWQGRSALSSLEGIISPAYTVVTPKQNVDAKYFSFLFKTPQLINAFYRNSQGLVDDTLNCKYKDFEIVKVTIPPTKKEQEEIAKVLILADEEIKLLENKRDQLKEQKKGLMQILLTGKKRLKIK